MLLITKNVESIYIYLFVFKVKKQCKGLILAVKRLILMPEAGEQMEVQPTGFIGEGHMDNACKPSS